MGPVFRLFDDAPEITEITINAPDEIYMTMRGRKSRVDGMQLPEADVASAIRELASSMGNDARPETPQAIVHAKLPGYRFAALLAPTATKGSAMAIRRHSPRVLSLDDYVASGTMPSDVADVIRHHVKVGSNMLVSGSTDSGKTTLLNAISREIPKDVRVGTIEDTRELQLAVDNCLYTETNTQKGLTATKLVEFLMRASPERIILGELRGPEAAAFLEAANTGHNGCMASLHCNSAYDALARLEILTLRADLGWPLEAIRQQIASTIRVVVHMARVSGRRMLNEVALIDGYRDGNYAVSYLYQRP